jgi:hypothetical protein
MPHANIWIRVEDWDKWQALPDKPDWIHRNLAVDILKRELQANPPIVLKSTMSAETPEKFKPVEKWSGPIYKKNGKL